jgi:hypothetical protein
MKFKLLRHNFATRHSFRALALSSLVDNFVVELPSGQRSSYFRIQDRRHLSTCDRQLHEGLVLS